MNVMNRNVFATFEEITIPAEPVSETRVSDTR